MDDKFTFSHAVYEVISEQTHKYAATSVSGGDMGRPVTSTTTHYSDQGLWLRDPATGKEKKFAFEKFNIAAREGHKLICVWHQATGQLEAVKNLTTDGTVLGINEFSKKNLCTAGGIIAISLVIGAVFLIPYVGALFCFIGFLIGNTPVGNLSTKPFAFYRAGFLVASLFYLWLAPQIVEYIRVFNFSTFLKYLFFINAALAFTAYTVANNYVVEGRNKLQAFLGEVSQGKS